MKQNGGVPAMDLHHKKPLVALSVVLAQLACGSVSGLPGPAATPVDTLEITAFMRGRDNSWVQDEALALLLLLEAGGVDWREAMLGPRVESPLRLLAHAMDLEW